MPSLFDGFGEALGEALGEELNGISPCGCQSTRRPSTPASSLLFAAALALGALLRRRTRS